MSENPKFVCGAGVEFERVAEGAVLVTFKNDGVAHRIGGNTWNAVVDRMNHHSHSVGVDTGWQNGVLWEKTTDGTVKMTIQQDVKGAPENVVQERQFVFTGKVWNNIVEMLDNLEPHSKLRSGDVRESAHLEAVNHRIRLIVAGFFGYVLGAFTWYLIHLATISLRG